MNKKNIIYTLVILAVIQLIQPTKNIDFTTQKNAIFSAYKIPEEAQLILKKACYDCHSNNTRYPWYANIQPVAYWLSNHIQAGKEELTKMLAGCQLTLTDTFVIEAEEHQAMQLINHYNPKKIILFGFTLSNTSFYINRALNKPFRYAGKAFLLTHTLTEISNQVQLKTTLWNSGLKPLFGIK